MSKLNIKHQILIVSGILVLMVVLFYFFAWTPQLTQLDDLESQAQAEQVKINAAKAKIAMLSEVKKNAANAEVELIKIQNKMPADAKLPSLVVELQNMANDAGVNLVSIKPSEPKAMGEYSSIDMNLSVVGSYVSLIDYLRRLEKSTRAMTVNSIDVKVAEYPDLALNMTASTFTMGAVGAPAPPATPATPVPAQQPSAPTPVPPQQPSQPNTPQQTSSVAPAVTPSQNQGAGQAMSMMQPMPASGVGTIGASVQQAIQNQTVARQ